MASTSCGPQVPPAQPSIFSLQPSRVRIRPHGLLRRPQHHPLRHQTGVRPIMHPLRLRRPTRVLHRPTPANPPAHPMYAPLLLKTKQTESRRTQPEPTRRRPPRPNPPPRMQPPQPSDPKFLLTISSCRLPTGPSRSHNLRLCRIGCFTCWHCC